MSQFKLTKTHKDPHINCTVNTYIALEDGTRILEYIRDEDQSHKRYVQLVPHSNGRTGVFDWAHLDTAKAQQLLGL